MTKPITFTEICTKQPRLADLYQGVSRDKGAANWRVWEAYKSQIRHLVGWESSSTNPDLCTAAAYDTVYNAFWEAWTTTEPKGVDR
jgi:hypothetical protein